MIRTVTDPRELILWHHFATSSELCTLVKDKDWFAEHPIPVFYTPKEFLSLGEFILNDGHKRSIGAMRQGMKEVPILILETTEDISGVNGDTSCHFDIVYQNLLNILRNKYADESMFSRLKEVRIRGYRVNP